MEKDFGTRLVNMLSGVVSSDELVSVIGQIVDEIVKSNEFTDKEIFRLREALKQAQEEAKSITKKITKNIANDVVSRDEARKREVVATQSLVRSLTESVTKIRKNFEDALHEVKESIPGQVDEELLVTDTISRIELATGDDRLSANALRDFEERVNKNVDFSSVEIDAKKIRGLEDLLPQNPPTFAGGSGATFLSSMRDTNIKKIPPTDGQALVWDATLGKWKAGAAGSGHTVQEEGVDLTQRTNLNFIGTGLTAADDAGNDATTVTLGDIEDLGTSLTAGSVVFSDGTNLAEDNANFFWDDTNNLLGVGTNTPSTTDLGWSPSGNFINVRSTTGPARLVAEGTSALFGFIASNAPVDEKLWIYGATGSSTFTIRSYNDAVSSFIEHLQITHSGDLALQPTDGYVGFGTETPEYILDVVTEESAGGAAFNKYNASATAAINYRFRRGRGTASSPGQNLADDVIGKLTFWSVDNASTFRKNVELRIEVPENTTSTSSPGDFLIQTTPSGSVSSVERLRVTSEGLVGIGETNPDELVHITGGLLKVEDTGSATAFIVDRTDGSAASLQAGAIAARFYYDEALDFEIGARSHANVVAGGGSAADAVFRIKATTDYIGIGSDVTPSTNVHIQESNTDTTPALEIEQLSTGDAALQFSIVGDSYAMGIDNSNSDLFTLSYSGTAGTAVLGTNNLLTVDSSGGLTLQDTGSPGVTISADNTTVAGRSALLVSDTGGDDTEIWLENDTGIKATFAMKAGQTAIVSAVPGATSDWYFFEDAVTTRNPEVRVYGFDDGAVASKYGSFSVDTAGDFNIEAQSGEVIRLRTGGADRVSVDTNGLVGINTTSQIATLHNNGSFATKTTTVTATSDTLDTTDHVVLVDDDTAGSAVTITLPAASGNDGLQYVIKKLGTTANVIIDGNASETIDGATTATLTTQYDSITIVCDGSNWHII